ncbi:MAG: DNA polymerase Y family protein [Pseudomonadota bacterium]
MDAPSTNNGLVTVTMAENARCLAAVDARAAAQGLFAGQSLTDALALWPHARIVEAEPEEDARALTRLADWCLRFSPAVAVDAPEGLLIDIDGCAHLWGGEATMAQMLRQRLAEQNIPSRIAIADTFAAAWALARYGKDETLLPREGEKVAAKRPDEGVVLRIECDAALHSEPRPLIRVLTPATSPPRGGEVTLRERLAPLPVEALRLEGDVAANLRRLGLKTVGQVLKLPRPALRKRFGAGLLLQIARALGEEEGAIEFRTPPTPWIERAVFAEPISAPEDLARVVTDLSARLCARLDEFGQGARRFQAVFHRVDGEAVRRSVRASLPLREAKRLSALFAGKLETVDPGFGVESVTLAAARTQALARAQTDFDSANPQAAAADLAPLIDRLVNRFGMDRVWRPALQESHVPERAVVSIAPLAAPTKRRWSEDQPRPVRLFQRPQPIEALAVAPDDPPSIFHWQGRVHRVRNAEGPERIGAEWWRKAWADNAIDRVRDYYCVEDETGARFWLFRTGLYGQERPTRWWLHGLFA